MAMSFESWRSFGLLGSRTWVSWSRTKGTDVAFVTTKRSQDDRWDPGGRGVALVGTVVLHAAVGAMFFVQPPPPADAPPVYAVRLVAAPRTETERPRPEVIERPVQQQPSVPVAPSEPEPAVETPPERAEPEPDREPAPQSTPDVEVTDEPSTGRDQETLEIPGVDFPFPGYLRNIVAQVYRRWSRPAGNVSLRAEVLFFIRRDGSIADFQFVERSGNLAFDLRAQGAVEAAGNAGAFGPLPDGFADDVLPVSFFFDPSTLQR